MVIATKVVIITVIINRGYTLQHAGFTYYVFLRWRTLGS